jgi:hypothetical protein
MSDEHDRLLAQGPRVAPEPLLASSPSPAPNTGAPAYTGYYGNPYGAVTVDFYSKPPRADVFVNGALAGTTPLRLNMVAGATYNLACERQGFAPERRAYTVRDRDTVQFDLQLTPEGRSRQMTRSEWFALEPMIGFGSGSKLPSLGLGLLVVGLKWRYLNWTILDLGGAGGGMSFVLAGTRPSFPFYLGNRGQHQLRIGFGLSIAYMESLKQEIALSDGTTAYNDQVGGTGILVTPSFEYRYQTERSFFFGVAVRPHVMVAGDFKTNHQGINHPWAIMLTVPMGWASSSI